jgi:DNA polymerase I-like protein with 3'-5' exonuclease and polymerase domains
MIHLINFNDSLIEYEHPNIKKSAWDTMFDYIHYSANVVYGVDTETSGFSFVSKDLLMLQIGDNNHQFIIDCRNHIDDREKQLIKIFLESDNYVKIFHNAKFDYKFLKKKFNAATDNIYDTYLAEKVLNCGKTDYGYGLGKVVERYLNVTLNKEIRGRFTDTASSPFTIDQIVYGAKDVEYLGKVRDMQLEFIDIQGLSNVCKLEMKATRVFAEIEYEGLIVDKLAWDKLKKINEHDSTLALADLSKHAYNLPELLKYRDNQLDMFSPTIEEKTTINWDSPTQVLKVFKIYYPEIDDVNGKKLNPYRYKSTLVDLYIKYKEKSKLVSAFGDNFNKFIEQDGKIHTNFQQILDTGRVSSSDPNMQQIPASNLYRNCFIAPKDYVFVSSDYSSQELNVIAYGSQDPVFLQALELNQDLHSVCAELVFGKEWIDAAEPDCSYMKSKEKCECKKHKKLRTQVKTINFGLAYGMGPKKLSETINSTQQEAKQLITKYFKAFPRIEKFLNGLGEFGKKNGYITTFAPFKRKRFFDTWTPKMYTEKENFMELGSIERASKNTPIQGSSADMTKLALVYIMQRIEESNLPVKIVMTVHDQIDTICPKDFAEEWKIQMTELMEKAGKAVIKNGLLKSDTTITEKWSK